MPAVRTKRLFERTCFAVLYILGSGTEGDFHFVFYIVKRGFT